MFALYFRRKKRDCLLKTLSYYNYFYYYNGTGKRNITIV